jgi:adenylyltransferase/sulfurtransferase
MRLCIKKTTHHHLIDGIVQNLPPQYSTGGGRGEVNLTAFLKVTYDACATISEGGLLMSYSINVKELKARLDKGDKLVLLDVREPWEHALAKLDESVLIPLGTLPHSLAKLDKNSEIIAYCHHGMRSADATGFLLQQGFANVKNLVGGIDAWSVQIDSKVPRY